jgi:hypothetical protein
MKKALSKTPGLDTEMILLATIEDTFPSEGSHSKKLPTFAYLVASLSFVKELLTFEYKASAYDTILQKASNETNWGNKCNVI